MLQTYDPRNRDLKVWINGDLVHRDAAGVSPFDSSVQNGDAVWEGLRVYDGRIFMLEAHLARLRRGARALRYEGVPSDAELIAAIRATLAANDMTTDVHLRLTLSRGLKYTSGLDPRINTQGCSLFILAEFKPPVYDRSGVRLITAGVRRPMGDVLDQTIHSCNQLTSILAKIQANAAGADDALMLDTRGFVAETNATHLFMVEDGVLCTPTTAACPEGITRMVVLDICRRDEIPHRVEDISPARFWRATEVFCTGTMGEIVPVVEIDGRPVGTSGDAPSPVTDRISEAFAARTRVEGVPVVG
ncbi:MAG: aminotransferase class IV [Phycisphaerales bacterium]